MTLRYIEACEQGLWHLRVWERGKKATTLRRIPYRCRSWRHDGPCRLWCGACDFQRVKYALESHSFWTYLVLTYPPNIRAHNDQLFKWGVRHWSMLRHRIVREFDKIKYIQTWEVHKSGKPHVNVMISNQAFYNAALRNHRWAKKQWLEPNLVATGWGSVSWLSPKDNLEQMAVYLTKLANELTGVGPKMQVPINAPKHFRRIRASRNTLPKRLRNEKITGRLLQSPIPLEDRPMTCQTVNSYPLELQEQGYLHFDKIR